MSQFWLTKGGDVQGTSYAGDLATKATADDVKRRYDASYMEDVAVGNITATVTATQVRQGLLKSTPGAAITLTSPTAALLVAADVDAAVGRGYEFTVINLAGVTYVITLAAGTGITLVGLATVAPATSATFYVRYTNVTASSEAITILRK